MARPTDIPPSIPGAPQTAGERHTVPAGVLFPLVEVVKHWNVSPDELLEPLGLREQDVSAPEARFAHSVYLAIIERARMLVGEPALGIFWGLQMRVSVFGYLGFATMSTATLRDAIELAIQFQPLGTTAEGLRLHMDGNVASLFLEEYADAGSVRDVVTFARLVGLLRIAETLTGRELHPTVEVAFPEPSYYRRFAHMAPPLQFERPTTRALFAAEVLDYPLTTADPVALRLASDRCTRELSLLSAGGRLVRKVRSLLWNGEGGVRSPSQIARAIHVSPRTLRRHLEAQGTSLSALVDQERRDRALLLLRSPELSLAEIAERLGYRSLQSFERAFRRWTGTTPAAYRRS
jgi:AraC-like DNA-binding protein